MGKNQEARINYGLPYGQCLVYRGMVNVDRVLQVLHNHEVNYLLIGGVNFLLNHEPVLTYDTDIWVEDATENLGRLNQALIELGAAWGPTDCDWQPISSDPAWLQRQLVYCLTTSCAALDVFREVKGLEGRFAECRASAQEKKTATGVSYWSLSDQHMLACQMALPINERKESRIATLRQAIASNIV